METLKNREQSLHVLYTIPLFSQDCVGAYARFHDVIHTLQQMEDPPWRFSIVPLMRYYGPPADNVLFADGPPIAKLARYLRHIARLSRQADIVHVVEGHFPYSLLTALAVSPGVPMLVGPNLNVGVTPESIILRQSQPDDLPWKLEMPKVDRGSMLNRIVFHRRSPFSRRYRRMFVFRGYRPFLEQAEDVNVSKLVTIPQGVRCDLFNPDGPNASFSSDFNILYIGDVRRAYLKGFDVFFAALSMLRRQGIVFHVYILGAPSPEIVRWLEHYQLAGFVTELGRVPRSDLAPYYRAADVFVCPSRYEMDVTTSIEALACGTPVVGTDMPGIASTRAFRNGDAADLAEKLVEVHEYSNILKAETYDNADRWDIFNVIDTFADVYQQTATNA